MQISNRKVKSLPMPIAFRFVTEIDICIAAFARTGRNQFQSSLNWFVTHNSKGVNLIN